MRWLKDQVLKWLQNDCQHPGNMVAVDILEGCGRGAEVAWCRRCGAIRAAFDNRLTQDFRLPDPNLWRGR
jgi:hypothetical protein